jgi:hypothetical protein
LPSGSRALGPPDRGIL